MATAKAILNYLNSFGIWFGTLSSLLVAVIFYILLGHYLRFNLVFVIGYTALITFIIIFTVGWCLEKNWPHLDWNQPLESLTPKVQPTDQPKVPERETPEEFLNRTLEERWPGIEREANSDRKPRRGN